jgi:MULE transposase domain
MSSFRTTLSKRPRSSDLSLPLWWWMARTGEAAHTPQTPHPTPRRTRMRTWRAHAARRTLTHNARPPPHTHCTHRTRLAAQALLDSETAEDFTWALGCLKEMGEGRQPQSIFTDADVSVESALNVVFEDSDKYRCAWDARGATDVHAVLRATCTHTHTPPRINRCYWHLKQNITKRLARDISKAEFAALLSNFTAAAYASTESAMRASWEKVMQASNTRMPYACMCALCLWLCMALCDVRHTHCCQCAATAHTHLTDSGSQ